MIARDPNDFPDQESFLNQVVDDILEAIRTDTPPSTDDLARLYPEHHEQLLAFLAGNAASDIALAGLTAAGRDTIDAELDDFRTQASGEGTAAPEFIPNDLGGYEVVEEVARGGMGVVLKVRDSELRRELAMKVMHPEISDGKRTPSPSDTKARSLARARFLEEAQVTAQLDHPGVVPLHEFGRGSEGEIFFTMQLVKGRELGEVFELARQEQEGWNVARAIGALVRVCQAIAYAHAKGVLHRDLKPSNVMTGRFGEIYVMDWGLAKVVGRKDLHDIRPRKEADLSAKSVQSKRRQVGLTDPETPLVTMDGAIMGTPAYMSPEQAKGMVEEVDQRSDTFSIGAMLYNLLTGQAPYVEPGARLSPHVLLSLVVMGPPTPIAKLNPTAPAELVAICEKAMAREKRDRYASTLDLAEDLQAYLDNRVVRAYQSGLFAEAGKWVRRNQGTAAALAALVILVVCGLTAFLLYQAHSNYELNLAYQKANSSWRLARANEERMRESEEIAKARLVDAQRHLYRSLLEKTRVTRLLREPGWRKRAFETLEEVARLETDERDPVELNSEAVACIEGFDTEHALELRTGWDGAWSLDFRPDSSNVAIGSNHGVRVFNVPNRSLLFEIPVKHSYGRGMPAVRFDPAGRYLACSLPAEDVRLIALNERGTPPPQLSETGSAQFLEFDERGNLLAVGLHDGRAVVFEVETGKRRKTVKTGHRHDNSVALSPGGEWLATRGSTSTVQLWSLTGPAEPVELGTPAVHIHTLAFSADGEFLLGSSGSHVAIVWDLQREEERFVLRGHTARVHGAAISADSLLTATCGDDATVRLWNTRTGLTEMVLRPKLGTLLLAVDISPNGRYVATSENSVSLYQLTSRRERRELRGHGYTIHALAFHPSRPVLASASWDRHAMFWDLETARKLSEIRYPSNMRVTVVAYSPDGSLVALSGGAYGNLSSTDHAVYVYSAETGKSLRRLAGHRIHVTAAAFDPKSERLASGAKDGSVCLWDLGGEPKPRHFAEPGAALVKGLAFLGDDSLLVARRSGEIAIQNLRDGSTIQRVKLPEELIDIALDGPHERLATAGRGGTVNVLSLPKLTTLSRWRSEGRVSAVALSPDGGRVFAAHRDRSIVVRQSGMEPAVFKFPPLNSEIIDVAVDPTGRYLASCGLEEVITLWDLQLVEKQLGALELESAAEPSEPSAERPIRAQENQAVIVWLDELKPVARDSGSVPAVIARYRELDRPGDDGPYRSGCRLHADGNYAAAMEKYAAAMASGDRVTEAYIQFGYAMRDLWTLLEAPSSADSPLAELSRAVETLKAVKSTLDAIPAAERLQRERRHWSTFCAGRLFLRAGEAQEALEAFEAVLRDDPENAESTLWLAKALAALGQNATALQRVKTTLKGGLEPDGLWDLWFETCAVDLGMSGPETLTTIRDVQEEWGEPRARAVILVLESIAEHGALRINCGGDEYRDKSRVLWNADQFYSPGGATSGARKNVRVTGTEDDTVYRTERWSSSPLFYRVPLPQGRYRLALHFSEIYFTIQGQRSFDVLVEGRPFLESYEPLVDTATVEETECEIDDGFLDLRFGRRVENPKISAIEIHALPRD